MKRGNVLPFRLPLPRRWERAEEHLLRILPRITAYAALIGALAGERAAERYIVRVVGKVLTQYGIDHEDRKAILRAYGFVFEEPEPPAGA